MPLLVAGSQLIAGNAWKGQVNGSNGGLGGWPSQENSRKRSKHALETDPEFREALLKEAVDAMLAGEVDVGKAVLRDYINATIGFKELGGCANKPAKSLMRMFGPTGNPQARNLFEIIGHIQRHEGIRSPGASRSVAHRQHRDSSRSPRSRRRFCWGNGVTALFPSVPLFCVLIQ